MTALTEVISVYTYRTSDVIIMQVSRRSSSVTAPSSRRRRPPRVAERLGKLGAERHVVGAAAPPEPFGRTCRRRCRRGWSAAAALGRGARAAGLGDRLQHGR